MMKRIYLVAVSILSVASILLLTGVVDQLASNFYLPPLSLIGAAPFGSDEYNAAWSTAMRRADAVMLWIGIGRIVIYISTLAIIVYGAAPILVAEFRRYAAEEVDLDLGSGNGRNEQLASLIRKRAGRKRSEAYSAMAVGLILILVGVGFVTRGQSIPEFLHEITPSDSMGFAFDDFLNSIARIDLDGSGLQDDDGDAQSAQSKLRTIETLGVGYIEFQKSIHSLESEARSRRLTYDTVLSASARIGVVLLLLLLAQFLLRVYNSCIDSAQQLDAIGDALLLAENDTTEFVSLREALIVSSRYAKYASVPSKLLKSINESLERLKRPISGS